MSDDATPVPAPARHAAEPAGGVRTDGRPADVGTDDVPAPRADDVRTDDVPAPPAVPPPPAPPSTRVDRWAWAVRLFRTRALAAAACRAGHVKVNGDRAKPATTVRPGDEVRVRVEGLERVVEVRLAVEKRVGAALVPAVLVDRTPPPPPRDALVAVPVRDRGAGRPTKRERREIDRLRGR